MKQHYILGKLKKILIAHLICLIRRMMVAAVLRNLLIPTMAVAAKVAEVVRVEAVVKVVEAAKAEGAAMAAEVVAAGIILSTSTCAPAT
jgi:hypothetical protein